MLVFEPDKRLSRFFRHYEVARSATADINDIDNTPPPEVMVRAQALAMFILDDVREAFGPYSPTSWYRCEGLERIVADKGFARWRRRTGGDWPEYFARKQHPKGESADIKIPGVSPRDIWDWIGSNISGYDQLILEFHKPEKSLMSGWVHVSYSKEHNRMLKFTEGSTI